MQTLPVIKKDAPIRNLETALVAYNGRLLSIGFIRPWSGTAGTSIRIRNHITGEVLAEHAWTGCMGSAIVDNNNIIHIFGCTNYANFGNKIIRSTLDPVTFAPSTPVDAMLPNAPFRFYNCDVTKYGNLWRATIEISNNSGPAVYFAESPDLITWVYKGGQLGAGGYVGCPSICWIPEKQAFFLTYLKSISGKFVTQVAKSTDNCFTFTYFNGNAKYPAGTYLLTPDAERDGINASDVSMAEFEGKVYGCYLNGDQSTWADYRTFVYEGTMAQLYAEFF